MISIQLLCKRLRSIERICFTRHGYLNLITARVFCFVQRNIGCLQNNLSRGAMIRVNRYTKR